MIERLFDPIAILIIVGIAVVGGIVGAIVASKAGESWTIAIEVALLAGLGALIARSLISLLLSLGGDTAGAGLIVGWGFFLWPGVIDTLLAPFGVQLLTSPPVLLWIALGVGGLCGLMDGVHRIRTRDLFGAATFVLDTTWGLAGTTNGDLLHIVNTFAGTHRDDGRRNAHRYEGGFHIKKDFAFTQGQVMSELSDGPGTPLYAHERTHVSQNRAFGPLFALTYIGWMVVMFIPGLVVSVVKGKPVREALEAWCYFNNPWEAWGYKVGEGEGASPRTAFGALIWSDLAVVVVALFYFAGALGLAWFAFSAVWLS
jgi:hypothetical protein